MWLFRSLRSFARLVPFIPVSLGNLLCAFIGLVYFLFNVRARRNVLANLANVDPSRNWLWRQATAYRVCVTVVANYYDLLRFRSADHSDALDHINVEGLEHITRARKSGRGVIIVSGHIGNFSVMARLPAALGLPAALIAERVEPPVLYHYMARLRAAMGIEVIPPGPGSLRRVINLLNDNGILLLAADRDVTRHGHPVTLFQRRTSLPAGPVILAMKTGAALIPAHTLRTSSRDSAVVIEPAICLLNSGDWERDINANLELLARHLERMISADPAQWAVLQRVWPPTTSYGRSEGMGSADDTVSNDVLRMRDDAHPNREH